MKSLDGATRVILEHTERHYEPVARILHDSGLFVSGINPKLIKDFGNNSLRKVKTDKADAMKIARYGLYTRNKTALKNNLISILDQTYPGANALFDSRARSDGSQKWVDFVPSFWHVACVRAMSQTAFTKRYHKWYE